MSDASHDLAFVAAVWTDGRAATSFVEYDPDTGAILSQGQMPRAALDHLAAATGGAYLAKSGHPDTHWVDVARGRRRLKTPCPAALDGRVLRGLPQPCTIEITDGASPPERYPETEAAVELTFDHPGTYTVRVLAVPHTPGSFTVTAP